MFYGGSRIEGKLLALGLTRQVENSQDDVFLILCLLTFLCLNFCQFPYAIFLPVSLSLLLSLALLIHYSLSSANHQIYLSYNIMMNYHLFSIILNFSRSSMKSRTLSLPTNRSLRKQGRIARILIRWHFNWSTSMTFNSY